MSGGEVERARSAFASRAWPEAFRHYAECDRDGALGGEDLLAYGEAAWWVGEGALNLDAWRRAYARLLDEGARETAGLAAIGLCLQHLYRAEESLGAGWLGRARRLLDERAGTVARGHLLDTEADIALMAGDVDTAVRLADEMAEIAAGHADATLDLLARFMRGRALVTAGRAREGLVLLDEAMLSVVEGALPPSQTGRLYCHMISICRDLGDPRRALEWTDATTRWCESQSSAGNFPPMCRIHHAHLVHLRGDWEAAEAEARTACEDLVGRYVGGMGDGWYAVAECRRRRGDHAGAEEAFERASACGREPLPGLAALRLARGQVAAALALLRRALAEQPANRLRRSRLLPAAVEAALAAGQAEEAAEHARELEMIAVALDTPAQRAEALLAGARVKLAAGDAAEALDPARAASRAWSELAMPYEAATARTVVADACRALGDAETSGLELRAARASFEALGAADDVRRIDALVGRDALPGRLTRREVEVLRLVAEGRTNKEVADALYLSEKTVGRHLENIFAKLGIGSRAAAAAFAAEHALLDPRRR